MTREEINERNGFKYLDILLKTNNGRIWELSDREKDLFRTLVTQFLSNESYYIKPINIDAKSLDSITILKTH